MEPPDIEATALLNGGLLVEPVPAAATLAAHIFFILDFLPKSLGKFTRDGHPSLRTSPIQGVSSGTWDEECTTPNSPSPHLYAHAQYAVISTGWPGERIALSSPSCGRGYTGCWV